jgi:hypothetical protein
MTVNQDEVFQLHIRRGIDSLTGIDKVNGAVYDTGRNKIMDIEFVDNGDMSKGDAKAMDGIYSTIIKFPSEGLYSIEAVLEVKDIPLRVTRLAMTSPMFGVEGWECLGAPFDATFNLTASLNVVADSKAEPFPKPVAMEDYGFSTNMSGEFTLFISTIRTKVANNSTKVSVNQDEVLQLRIYKDFYLLTGMDKVNGIVYTNGNRKIDFYFAYDGDLSKIYDKVMDIEFMDNGDKSKGDAKAMDGIYSTIFNFPNEGHYMIKVVLEEKDLPLRVTRLSLPPPLDGVDNSERLGEPFNATFSMTAVLYVEADSTVKPLLSTGDQSECEMTPLSRMAPSSS